MTGSFGQPPPTHHNGRWPIHIDAVQNAEHSAGREALRYWQSSCGGKAMPSRGNIDPLGMRRFLDHVCLFDVHNRTGSLDDFRVRLIGSRVEEVFGNVPTLALREALPAETAARWGYSLAACLEARGPVRASGRVKLPDADFIRHKFDYIRYEVVLAPLSGDGAAIDMIFTAASFWTNDHTSL